MIADATKLPTSTDVPEDLKTGVKVYDDICGYNTSYNYILSETIRHPNDPTKFLFLLWKDGRASYAAPPQEDGKVHTLPEAEFVSNGDLRLPDRIMPYGDLDRLLTDLIDAICKFVDLSEDDALLVSLYVLSSWFPDCMKAVPYLWLVGPLGSGKSTLLRFLHCVCRRAVLVGDVRAASLYKMSTVLYPTLLIDELEPDGSKMGAEVRRLLRIGNTPGVPAARNGQLFQTFSFKAISSRQPTLDVALASRAIVIRLLPTSRDVLPLDEPNMEEIARVFQPKLLMFRLENYASVKKSRVAFTKVNHLTPRTRDLVQGMAAPLLGEARLEDKLIAILGEYDRDARIERSLEPEWLVVEALFDLCHKHLEACPNGFHVLVGGVSTHVNESLAFRGESIKLTPRSAGSILKSLGIRTRRLGNLGRGLTFTSSLKAEIHRLAQRFGFDRRDFATLDGLESGYGGRPCALCEKFDLTGNLRFVNLRTGPSRNFRKDQPLLVHYQPTIQEVKFKAAVTSSRERATHKT